MQWARSRIGLAGIVGLVLTLGAAPPTPSYHLVRQRIDQARERLSGDGQSSENAGNWNTFFDAVVGELEAQARAETAADRLQHLERLGRMRDVLAQKAWGPSNRVHAALSDWLQTRLEVALALNNLEQAVAQLPGRVAGDADEAEGNEAEGEQGDGQDQIQDRPRDRETVLKEKWSTFVDRFNDAIREYESAQSVSQRLNAARRLRGGLASLRWTQAYYPWAPASQLSAALHGLLDQPNVQIVADVSIVGPFLNQHVVNPEVIYFRGQTSYVQPGVRTGFGLLHSNEGIAFYNSQWSHSTTPVSDFQQQVAQDPQGRQAANMYNFGATIFNTNHVTATAVITPDGLVVMPENAPLVSAAFGAAPQPGLGPGLFRFVASLIGYNQGRILDEVRENAMPQIQQETASGTAELAAIKSAEEAGRQNAMLRQYLVGNRTLRFQDFAVTQLGLSSAPWAAYVSGVLQWAWEAGPQVGADFPKPPEFLQPSGGLTVDVHLNSTLTNLAAGLFRTGQVAQVENLLVKIVPPEGDVPLTEGIEVTQNASYEELLAAIDDVRSRSSDPNATVLRVTKPSEPPVFAVDSEGNLVAFVRGVTIEVAAPENFGQRGPLGFGGRPRVLRFLLDEAELTLAARFSPENGGRAVRVQGELASITYGGAGTTVLTVGDQEDQTQTLNLLTRSGALGVLAGELQGQDVDMAVPTDMLQGFLVAELSELHPSGWMRAVLVRDPYQPIAAPGAMTTAAAPAPAPPAATGYAQPVMMPTGYAAQ